MSCIQLIISDLHLADKTSILDCFGERQQAAFDGLLTWASSSNSDPSAMDLVELIINGDCFDFLVTTPYNSNKTIDASIALQKIDKIIAAHRPFFTTLHHFIDMPGRTVTFTIGNHDLELCIPEVCWHIIHAITDNDAFDEDERIRFCFTRFYQPFASLYIEHGNFYDFWNHVQQGIWNEQGNPLPLDSTNALRPLGSLYYQGAAHQISTQYPYFDHFDPSLSIVHQTALLCLFNPELVKEVTQGVLSLLSYPRKAFENLTPQESNNAVRLFEEVMQDIVAFQNDMAAQKQDWKPLDSPADASSTFIEDTPAQSEMEIFLAARAALSLPLNEAVKALCTPSLQAMEGGVTKGMHRVLETNPSLRLTVAGHTHHMHADRISSHDSDHAQVNSSRAYFNTSSWTTHYAVPTPEEITPELVTWLSKPDWTNIPLRDITQFLFVLVSCEDSTSETFDAQLCEWQGGINGSYRVLVRA